MKKDKVVVGLLSHYFRDTNLGCTALSICNMIIIDRAARELGLKVEYKILCNEKQPHEKLAFTDSAYEYRVYPSTKQSIKHPFRLLGTKVFDGCDIVFNLCAGDGFTDIYGRWRTVSETYMTILGRKKGCKMVLAPQTIGPFKSRPCSALARYTMNGCEKIFVRDNMSYQLCCEMGQKDKTTEVIDVALALPYTKLEQPHDRMNIGINVSGLLYNGGASRFGLTIDYRSFIHDLVRSLEDKGARVHLIAHVLIPNGAGEDDRVACQNVHREFPNTILAPEYDSPIDIKGYIAGMDLFIGARMHATIAAISSGVPVIPVAYSRKVNGLYGNLQYPHYIDAKDQEMDTKKAVVKTLQMIDAIVSLRENIVVSREIYRKGLSEYCEAVKTLLSETCR